MRQHETASDRVHERLQNASSLGGTRGTAPPPVVPRTSWSPRSTGRPSRSPRRPRGIVRSRPVPGTCALSFCAWANPAPSTRAAFVRGAPPAVRALRELTSMANWAPWFGGNPSARTSILRSLRTDTVVYVPEHFCRAMAPASRHSLANVRSGASTRDRNLLDQGQAPRCVPTGPVSRRTRDGTP